MYRPDAKDFQIRSEIYSLPYKAPVKCFIGYIYTVTSFGTREWDRDHNHTVTTKILNQHAQAMGMRGKWTKKKWLPFVDYLVEEGILIPQGHERYRIKKSILKKLKEIRDNPKPSLF